MPLPDMPVATSRSLDPNIEEILAERETVSFGLVTQIAACLIGTFWFTIRLVKYR